MRTPIILAVLVAVGGLLSGCATGARLTPEQAQMLLDGFHKAGCGGSIIFHGNAGTGQLGGQASVTLDLNGECPTNPPPLGQ